MIELEREKKVPGFSFFYEGEINGETIFKIPPVSPNKPEVLSIAWQSTGNISLFGTISGNPEGTKAIWDSIEKNAKINPAVTAVKIIPENGKTFVAFRVLMG